MVSVLAIYSDNPSSNPADVYSFSVIFLKRTKINKKEAGVGAFKKRAKVGGITSDALFSQQRKFLPV